MLIGALGALVVVLTAAVVVFAVRGAGPGRGQDAPQGQEVVVVPAAPDSLGGSGPDAEPEPEPEPEPVSVPDRDLERVGTARPSQPARSAASYGPARVDTDGAGLLLRAGPGRGYDILGKMLPGDVVSVDGCEAGTPGRRWCAVIYGGLRGWALDEFLAIGAPPSDTDSGLEEAFAAALVVGRSAYIDGNEAPYVNLRERPYVGGSILTKLKPGASLYVVRCLPQGWSLGGRPIEGRWCFVNADQRGRSISGWASDGALRW